MLQNYNYSTEKILTEQPIWYRNANQNKVQILKELQFRCISTMAKNVKPHQKGPGKASTAWSHVSKFGSLCGEIHAGKELYHKRIDTKHLTRPQSLLSFLKRDDWGRVRQNTEREKTVGFHNLLTTFFLLFGQDVTIINNWNKIKHWY